MHSFTMHYASPIVSLSLLHLLPLIPPQKLQKMAFVKKYNGKTPLQVGKRFAITAEHGFTFIENPASSHVYSILYWDTLFDFETNTGMSPHDWPVACANYLQHRFDMNLLGVAEHVWREEKTGIHADDAALYVKYHVESDEVEFDGEDISAPFFDEDVDKSLNGEDDIEDESSMAAAAPAAAVHRPKLELQLVK